MKISQKNLAAQLFTCHEYTKTPKDIAALCLFLASEESAFINGADLVIDGGVQRKLARRPLP